MSLRVWLPLNGDLRNNGLSDVTITNNGATVDTNGKIGKCYSFNGSSNYLLSTQNFLTNSTGDWTYCCWMKLNSTTAGQCLFSCRTAVDTTGITIFYYGSKWYIDDGARWSPANTISANTWYHISIVHKQGTGIFIYINGVLDKSTTTTHNMSTIASNFTIGASQNTSNTVSGNYLNGKLNDVRIYDHALSAKEVKELSKGLVVHYSLSEPLDSNDTTIYDCSGYNNNGIANGTFTYSNNSGRYNSNTIFNGTSNYIEANALPSETKTISVWAKTAWTTTSSYQLAIHDLKTRFALGQSQNRIGTYAYSSTGGLGTKIPLEGTSYTANQWNHIVIVKTGTDTRDVYINGVLATPDSDSYFTGDRNNKLTIGNRHKSGSYTNYFDGELSDFRAQVTELSAEDVQALYNAPISVAKPGTLLTQGEFVEASASSFRKTGIVTVNGVSENDTIYGFNEYDGNVSVSSEAIKAEDFIEY